MNSEDDRDKERKQQRKVPVDKMLQLVGDRVRQLEGKERELGGIYATLYVNFIKRETYGVQLTSNDDCSTQQLMLKVFERLGAENERLQLAINDAVESGDTSHLVSTNSQGPK